MSTHPNAILLVALTPDGLSRKTMRDILLAHDVDDDDDIKIGDKEYHHEIMESDYSESWQIKSKEGDLVFFDYVTYGYGDAIGWDKLDEQKRVLESWAILMCERYHCSYEIRVTANYW
jgi:hypothetical protein